MAIIYSYPEVTSLQADDKFIISRFPSDPDEISNYSLDLDTLSSYINTGQATVTQVDDRVVTNASFNTSSGVLTLTRSGGEISSVTTNLDGRYYLSSNPSSYTSNLGVVQSLTTNNSSGVATLVNGTLNIPQYSGGGGGGDTYDLNAGTKSGNSVPLNLTSGSGSDNSLVNLTEGSNVQLTQTSANEITISSTGGTVTGAWQTLNSTFTGNELKNAFNGNNTDKITLVTVGTNEIVSLGFCTFICKASTTGTTNYTNTGNALYVIPENTGGIWGIAIDNNLLQSSFQDQVSQNLPGVARSNTNSGNRPVGANLVLGNPAGFAANVTQGDRDFIIQITYRITNF